MTYSDSSCSSSSESEVEYEPIVLKDSEGHKTVIKSGEESNPLAPVVLIDTKSSQNSKKNGSKTKKVFATRESMLSLIESVNNVQDSKIQQKLDRDAAYLERLGSIERMQKERKSMKNERLDKIKDNLRKGGVRVKGENKKKVKEMMQAKESDKKKSNNRNFSKKQPMKPSQKKDTKKDKKVKFAV